MLAGIRSLGRGGGPACSSATPSDELRTIHPIELILSRDPDRLLGRRVAARPGDRDRSSPPTGRLRGRDRHAVPAGRGRDRARAAEGAAGPRAQRARLVMRYGVTLQGVDEPAAFVELVRLDRGARLRRPLDHRLVAARGRLLRLRDAGAPGDVAAARRHGGHQPARRGTRRSRPTRSARLTQLAPGPRGLRDRRRGPAARRARPADGEARRPSSEPSTSLRALWRGETVDGAVGAWRFVRRAARSRRSSRRPRSTSRRAARGRSS